MKRPGFLALIGGALALAAVPLHALAKDDVFTNGSAWVIARSASEAERIYRKDDEKYSSPPWDGEYTFVRCDDDEVFQMYHEDAHDDPFGDECPLNTSIYADACDKCSPIYTRKELIESYGHGAVIREYQ